MGSIPVGSAKKEIATLRGCFFFIVPFVNQHIPERYSFRDWVRKFDERCFVLARKRLGKFSSQYEPSRWECQKRNDRLVRSFLFYFHSLIDTSPKGVPFGIGCANLTKGVLCLQENTSANLVRNANLPVGSAKGVFTIKSLLLRCF